MDMLFNLEDVYLYCKVNTTQQVTLFLGGYLKFV